MLITIKCEVCGNERTIKANEFTDIAYSNIDEQCEEEITVTGCYDPAFLLKCTECGVAETI